MRAVVVEGWTDPADLRVSEIPAPEIAPGTLRVGIRAAGCNFFDILMVRGEYQVKPPFPFIPGAEIAGVVTEVGAGVTGFAVGDRVLAAAGLGAFATETVVPAAACHRMPNSMSFAAGAALPIVYPTSYAALVFRGGLAPTEHLLVHAAAGGVGLAAVQIGKSLGAHVIATAGGDDKLEIARRAGADVAIDYRSKDWVAKVNEATGGHGADVIYDPVGGDIFDASRKVVAFEGRILVIGFVAGRFADAPTNHVLVKNYEVVGVHWGYYRTMKPELIPHWQQRLDEMWAARTIDPLVGVELPLREAPEALRRLASRGTTGKVVLLP